MRAANVLIKLTRTVLSAIRLGSDGGLSPFDEFAFAIRYLSSLNSFQKSMLATHAEHLNRQRNNGGY